MQRFLKRAPADGTTNAQPGDLLALDELGPCAEPRPVYHGTHIMHAHDLELDVGYTRCVKTHGHDVVFAGISEYMAKHRAKAKQASI